ncbi:hypothetical protein VR43_31925 [Streptomyces sp. NRRL S-104]|nr:hypothetical protein VR43_31925 [Streptomyces sp. NRRL S-104]
MESRADGGDGAVPHQDVGVLDRPEGTAAAEAGIHGEYEGGPTEQDRPAGRGGPAGRAARGRGAGGDAQEERCGGGQAEAGEEVASLGAARGVGMGCMACYLPGAQNGRPARAATP